jgi:hypothetical protein
MRLISIDEDAHGVELLLAPSDSLPRDWFCVV